MQESQHNVPRYSDRLLPAYRFVPGQTPHPTRDPAGHSYGIAAEELASFDSAKWATCPQYLYGVDLFNHEYWWEAHEVWEIVWRAAGRQSAAGLFVQGLIQISAARLKLHQGFERAARRLAGKGLAKVSRMQGTYLGIDVAEFRVNVENLFVRKRPLPVLIQLVC